MAELNCPNCGAPLGVLDRCEYCGTYFVDCTMDADKPFYIKIRHGGVLHIDKVRLKSMRIEQTPEYSPLWCDNTPYIYMSTPQISYEIELEHVGTNMWHYKEDEHGI